MPTYDKPQFHTSEGYFVGIYNNIKLSTKKQTNKQKTKKLSHSRRPRDSDRQWSGSSNMKHSIL